MSRREETPGAEKPTWLEIRESGLELRIHVQPKASRSEVSGEHDGRLKIRVAAPPVDGAANDELVRFLAKRLKRPRSGIAIIRGTASRKKDVYCEGLEADAALAALVRKG